MRDLLILVIWPKTSAEAAKTRKRKKILFTSCGRNQSHIIIIRKWNIWRASTTQISSMISICEQKFVQYGAITFAIDCNGLSLLSFEENYPIMPLDQNTHQTMTRFGCVGFLMYACGFLCPKCENFACLHTRQGQNVLHVKRYFFMPKSASSVRRLQAHFPPFVRR